MRNLILVFFSLVFIMSCDRISYRKTAGGMPYQIFPSTSGKSIAKGNFVKINFIQKINDSVYSDTHGKMPAYRRVNETSFPYDISELWTKLKSGDSVITVQMMDTFMKRNPGAIPPQFKKGDRVISYVKILDVFTNDSLARADNDIEMKKDEPRRKKEMAEQAAKNEQLRKEQMAKDDAELKSSGEMDKELREMENYLAAKKITAQKTGRGTFVQIAQQGNGPNISAGDSLTVKYSGRRLINDSVFQTSTYTFPVGMGQVIPGWDEGLLLFKKGGKGTIFIPGFLAYGKNPPPGSPFTQFDPLIFDVEILDVKK